MSGIFFILAYIAGWFLLLIFGVVIIGLVFNYSIIGINKLLGRETKMASEETIAEFNRKIRDQIANRRR